MLKILGASSSGYYDYLKRENSNQKIRKQQVKQEITEIYNESKQIYGAPKIKSLIPWEQLPIDKNIHFHS